MPHINNEGIRVRKSSEHPLRGDWISTRRSDAPSSPPTRIVLYVHGGAFALCTPATHRGITVGLAQALRSVPCKDTEVFALAYRHPPTSPHPAPLEDVVACYKHLLSTTQPPPAVVLAGDSSGGALVVQALLNIRDDPTLPDPAGALLLSPWCDLEETSGGTWDANASYDYLPVSGVGKFARAYGGKVDPGKLSVKGADLKGLPLLMVTAGAKEVLRGQIEAFVETAREKGVEVEYYVEPGMVHVFQVFAAFVGKGLGERWFEQMAKWIHARFEGAETMDVVGEGLL